MPGESPRAPGANRLPLARGLSPSELEALVAAEGGKAFHGRILAEWVHQKGVLDWERISNLSKVLRQRLARRMRLSTSTVLKTSVAEEGTKKYLLKLEDGESIEMVLIPEGRRNTLCMSSQVGCPIACIFCASGLYGVRRNLGSEELIEQFLLARQELGETPLTNIVVMGLGEPMLNLAELLPALERIVRNHGFSARRITVSTSGTSERIRRFARSGHPYGLALSLHAADAELRKQLVPTATEEPEVLVQASQDYFRLTGREPTFEIVLLRNRNDEPQHARALVRLLQKQRGKVNLIPWNPVEEIQDLFSPEPERVERFREILEEGGLKVTLRRRRGRDRNAACGQLRLNQLVEPA
ncbi:MAG TPA: 23S rRNA (adenine(2503)-C(2))-methyltransferase RlmN [Planctomycetes bacterium]|nr:23S rRNA (adenine(2503)-C(2))-methyltransferase RlmN [Planctomycetota bacterium]